MTFRGCRLQPPFQLVFKGVKPFVGPSGRLFVKMQTSAMRGLKWAKFRACLRVRFTPRHDDSKDLAKEYILFSLCVEQVHLKDLLLEKKSALSSCKSGDDSWHIATHSRNSPFHTYSSSTRFVCDGNVSLRRPIYCVVGMPLRACRRNPLFCMTRLHSNDIWLLSRHLPKFLKILGFLCLLRL